jgi:hypothetical protein
MIRCVTLAAALIACALPAAAQMQRNFPANALRGELVVLQPPDAQLNGRPARLAPGARIRGDNNLLVVSGTIANQRLWVHYTLDTGGQLLDVWVLTATELARPWPISPEQARAWAFDPARQSWSRP